MNLSTLKSRLVALTGFKKYAAAFGLGALMTLSTPPIGAFYVLLICVPGLIWLARNSKTKRETFLTGWAFGAGYFIFGLYWVSFALFVDIQSFWWALPFSAILGPAVVALYYALVPLLVWRFRKDETAYALMLVAAWALSEWVRGHALTGFPWNLPGYTWQYFLPVMQVNAAIGIYGLTLLTLLWAAIPALNKKLVPFVLVSFLLVASVGMVRLYLHPTAQSGNNTVRIVQPNIPQSVKWNRDEMRHNYQHILDLTSIPAKQPPTFVIWPETAIIADLQHDTDLAHDIVAHMPKGSTGVFGTLRSSDGQFFNSVTILDSKAHVLGNYNKHHLVPFGEYVPFRQYLNMTPVANGIADIGDFTRGDGVTTMSIGANMPKPSPLVCYEAIFPGAVARQDDRPDWLVNVTNDGWYGKTAGPHQHFESVRVRAIEEGLPLVRSANTGISAVIDPLGRVIGKAALGSTGVIDAILPAPLPPTVYSRFGDTLFFLMLILLGIFGETLYSRK